MAHSTSTTDEKPRSNHRSPKSLINAWWDRLFSAILGNNWDNQPFEFDSGRSGHDYIFNTVGSAAWGALFPALTVVATQLSGVERAGQFTMAFTTATLLLYIGNYGVKTYQISDIDETESFSSYCIQRLMTVGIMLVVGFLYCALRGYDNSMWLISAGAYGYRALDALSDCFEARLQQQDKLYLAGLSQTVRSVVPVVIFTLLLLITGSLEVASIALAVAAIFSFLLFTMPLTRLETTRSRKPSAIEIREIFVECFAAFLSLFLFALIENIPKFAMEGVLTYDSQVYFTALYFPAQSLLMIVGFVYRPQLVRIANIWADPKKHMKFDLIVLTVLGVCVVVTLGGLIYAKFIAVPLNGIMYAADFEPYRGAQYLMMIAGGITAGIDFLFQILTVLRKQAQATRIYLLSTLLALIISPILIRVYQLEGAVYSYLAVMVVLFAALVVTYIMNRLNDKKDPYAA